MLRILATVVTVTGFVLPQSPSSDTAMGVFPFLVGNLDGQVQTIVDDCANAGLDTIYVSVFRATGPSSGDLWITDARGTWSPAWGPVRSAGRGIDLVRLIAAAKQKNLRVVGVLKCFDDNVQPTDAAHRRYLLDVIGYLVDGYDAGGAPVYDLDGLALDYIRFVGNGTGNDPRVVTAFLADVRSAIGALSLHCYLIANRYTFDGPTYDGKFASYSAVIASLASQFGQHWEQMARYVDVMMPMCYTANGSIYSTYALHQAYVRQAAAYCKAACAAGSFPGRRVQPVIKTYQSSGETTTAQTVEASITGALLGGGDGYQAFRWGTMRTEPTWWAKLQAYAVPGSNWPVPELGVAFQGLSATFDPAASRDREDPSAALQVRYDFGNDGTWDTGWQANVPYGRVVQAPGRFELGVAVRDLQGHAAATTRLAHAPNVLTAKSSLFATFGGSVPIALDCGPVAAGSTYWVLGTLSGSTPGVQWLPGFLLPLNPDGFTEALMIFVNSPVLQNGLATLDAQGRATATFFVPAGVLAPLAYRRIDWAAIGVDRFGIPSFVTNAANTIVLP